MILLFGSPQSHASRTSDQHYETFNGYQVNVYNADCIKQVPDPVECPKVEEADTKCGNPVEALTGAKIASELDYVSGDGLLRVSRSYSSQIARWSWGIQPSIVDFSGRSVSAPPYATLTAPVKLIPKGIYINTAQPALVDTPRSFPLIKDRLRSTESQVWVFEGSGRRSVFIEQSVGSFITKGASKPRLSWATDGNENNRWNFVRPDLGYQIFSASGELERQVFADGRYLVFARAGNSLTVRSMPGGRTLMYSRVNSSTPSDQYDTVTLPDSSQLRFAIGSSALIDSVTYADSSSKTYLYNEPAYSGLTDPNSPQGSRLTGLIDEGGSRVATYTYDSYGPIATELANGVNKYTFNTAYPGSSGSRSFVAPPSGGRTTMNYDTGPDGEPRLLTRSQPAGAGSSASTTSLTYDSGGSISSVTDYKGNRTCFANDLNRGVEILRLEGLSSGVTCPTDIGAYSVQSNTRQRKITTQLHPDWNFPTARAEPRKVTRWVYNGQIDSSTGQPAQCAPATALLPNGEPIAVICKRVEQSTTDATGTLGFGAAIEGEPRTWAYTYSGYGQVLTANGPRTDVNDAATYTYYDCDTGSECGMVHTITNALGQTTTYNVYNAHGQPLTITDPNGTVTTLAYDLRQRLTSRTVGIEQTSFQYWPTGLLKKVTLSDGSYLEYTYDAAHRLTAINDAEGNRIAYTLDSAGNRTKEDRFDAYNTLANTQTRAFDALSRTSQEIGAAGDSAVTTSFTYDNNGNQTSINAPLGRNTSQTYDELNRLTQGHRSSQWHHEVRRQRPRSTELRHRSAQQSHQLHLQRLGRSDEPSEP